MWCWLKFYECLLVWQTFLLLASLSSACFVFLLLLAMLAETIDCIFDAQPRCGWLLRLCPHCMYLEVNYVLQMELRRVQLISLLQAIKPVGGYTTESVTHGQCDARHTVTFLANGRYQFILLGKVRHTMCEQLAKGRYMKRCGRESNLRPPCCKPDALTTTTPRHTALSWSGLNPIKLAYGPRLPDG